MPADTNPVSIGKPFADVVKGLDLAAMDAIGWNVSVDAPPSDRDQLQLRLVTE